MADALCGPSNAIQNFQKHSSVDRTLQQDRLTSRQSPGQGFRSSSGPNAGLLDPEFEAFQAGHNLPPQPNFQLLPHAQPQHTPFAQAPQAPDWASDFQRLNIAPSFPPPQLQRHPPVANASASWHQDFMSQQQPALHQTPVQQHNMFGGGMSYMGSGFQQRTGFGAMNGAPLSQVASGKQPVQESMSTFDEAAFERAFAEFENDQTQNPMEAYQEVLRKEDQDNTAHAQAANQQPIFDYQLNVLQEEQYRLQDQRTEEALNALPETDPVLAELRNKRPSVYYTIKFRSALDLGDTQQSLWLDALDMVERQGVIATDASEGRWCVDSLNKIAAQEIPATVKDRIETLIKSTNERLMSQHPFTPSLQRTDDERQFWNDLEQAGYRTRSPLPQQRDPETEKAQEQDPSRHDDDEMAETAGRLLERVADNTSEKFQNSQFLSLMRRLRDREVRVEGDKMVDIPQDAQNTTPSSIPPTTTIPGIDPQILNHAATDFDMPMDSTHEQDYGLDEQRSI